MVNRSESSESGMDDSQSTIDMNEEGDKTVSLLTLPFDEYQRYRIVTDIINQFRMNGEVFTILDVGSGGREILGRFLPNDGVTYLDMELPEGYEKKENFILGDITKMHLRAAYDFIVSIDTFEHIAPGSREHFLNEILNASATATIITAPFDTEGVASSEARANELYERTHGGGYRWLLEHSENGLPSVSRILKHIEGMGLEHVVIPNGFLDRWSKMISVFLLTEGLPQFSDAMTDLFEFYNENIYPLDTIRPAYRQVIVVNKRENKPDLAPFLSTDIDPEVVRETSKILDAKIAEIQSRYKASSEELIRYLTREVRGKQREIDDLNVHMKRAVEDVDHLMSINLQNQKRLEEFSVIPDNDELIRMRDAQIKERDSLIEKQAGKIEEMEALVLERDVKIKEMGVLIIERDKKNNDMGALVQERGALAEGLEDTSHNASQKKEMDALIAEKDAIIQDRDARLQNLEDTITVRSLRKFQRLERVILPPSSRRWRLYSSLFHRMRGALLKPKVTISEEAPEGLPELVKKYPRSASKVADIICFPIIDWHFRYQRPQQLLSRFAQNGHRVFYLTVELEPLKKEYVVREIAENIIEVHLSVSSPFNVYNDTLTEEQIESLLSSFEYVRRDFDIGAAISFVDFPSWQPLTFRLKDAHGWKVLYDCMDEHTGFSNIDESIIQEEKALIMSSDLVVTTSAHLQRKVGAERDDTVLIPNAGDYDHFCRALHKESPFDVKGPVVGYYGAIAEWFDNELVEYLANERPDWRFVLIGHTFGSDISRLESLPNVQFLGEKPYAELPNYLCGFDVCIIPFRLTPLIKATHPVKFYEYLAAGKPVVSSRLTELEPFKDLCYLADDKDDFLKKVEKALDEDGKDLKDKRMEFAKEHTWDERYAILESHIKRLFIPRGA